MKKLMACHVIAGFFFVATCIGDLAGWQNPSDTRDLDARVRKFLESRRGAWHDLNVPPSDGQALYNIIVEHKYKSALEIGTSTGHSGIWIAWALSKTGGRLITIEIDASRREEALKNFKEAGVAQIIDSRLGDAHEIVPSLPGPFDFVFCDADKDWYVNYLAAALPKLSAGGCFVAHNISEHSYAGYSREFLQYARGLPYLETVLSGPGGAGMSISYKKADTTPVNH
jgi:predicted O-methyltransferase YrrM